MLREQLRQEGAAQLQGLGGVLLQALDMLRDMQAAVRRDGAVAPLQNRAAGGASSAAGGAAGAAGGASGAGAGMTSAAGGTSGAADEALGAADGASGAAVSVRELVLFVLQYNCGL